MTKLRKTIFQSSAEYLLTAVYTRRLPMRSHLHIKKQATKISIKNGLQTPPYQTGWFL